MNAHSVPPGLSARDVPHLTSATCGTICPMTFRSGGSLDRQVSTGGGRGGPIAIGGGFGGLLLVGLYLLLGGDLSGGGGQPQQPAPQPEGQSDQSGFGNYNDVESDGSLDHCQTTDDANKYDDCRIIATAQSLDEEWATLLPEQAGIDYTKPGLQIFSRQTQTGCGAAQSSTGPFYCPADGTAYFDTSFFDQLTQMGGSDAPLAQEYVVAHEFGHHIQDLEGTLGMSNYDDPGPESNAVKIELQADCYAGLWATQADEGDNKMLEPLTEEQVASAIQTAGAIGDDHIQKQSGGYVNPESFTHGSSEQRQKMFMAGYNGGTMESCDILGTGGYNY